MRDGEHTIRESVRRQLAGDPRIGLARHCIALSMEDGGVIMEGEVEDLAAKKLALERAANVPGVNHVIDRIRVAPARHMTDAEIRDHLRDLLVAETSLQPLLCAAPAPGAREALAADTSLGVIGFSVRDGVVTLDGIVPSLSHKRLAGLLAWWVPGTRDVVNGLEVVPREKDSDDEITDAVRLALEKDPLVDAPEITVSTRGAVVRLTGVVRSDVQRRAAERDAWSIFGVDGVSAELRVRRG